MQPADVEYLFISFFVNLATLNYNYSFLVFFSTFVLADLGTRFEYLDIFEEKYTVWFCS
jgi:hypothetical protein